MLLILICSINLCVYFYVKAEVFLYGNDVYFEVKQNTSWPTCLFVLLIKIIMNMHSRR